MDVRTNAGKSCRNKELLRVPVKSVIRLSRQPAIEAIAVSHQETACISGALPNCIPGCILCVESRSLNADLRKNKQLHIYNQRLLYSLCHNGPARFSILRRQVEGIEVFSF